MVSNVEPEAGLTIQSERETCDLHQLRSSLHGCSFRLEGMVKFRSVTEESGVKVEDVKDGWFRVQAFRAFAFI